MIMKSNMICLGWNRLRTAPLQHHRSQRLYNSTTAGISMVSSKTLFLELLHRGCCELADHAYPSYPFSTAPSPVQTWHNAILVLIGSSDPGSNWPAWASETPIQLGVGTHHQLIVNAIAEENSVFSRLYVLSASWNSMVCLDHTSFRHRMGCERRRYF